MERYQKQSFVLILFIVFPFLVPAQSARHLSIPGANDSLSLQQILQEVTSSYPSVLKAQEAINSADAAVALARSGYYPDISGHARLYPAWAGFQIIHPEHGCLPDLPGK